MEFHLVFFEGDRDPQSLRNVILVATDGASPSTEFAQRWDAIRARSPRASTWKQPIRDRWAAAVPFGDVPLLTDDYAPTDALLLLFG